jgi:hypothetical protein
MYGRRARCIDVGWGACVRLLIGWFIILSESALPFPGMDMTQMVEGRYADTLSQIVFGSKNPSSSSSTTSSSPGCRSRDRS